MKKASPSEIEEDFLALSHAEQKECIAILQMLECDGVLESGLSVRLLALLKAEYGDQ